MPVHFRNILFPTDFSSLSLAALPFARTLLESHQGQLHCLYVVDDANLHWTTFGPEAVPLGPPLEEFVQQGRQRMERFVREQLGDIHPAPISDVRAGRPFAQIIGYAREKAIDVIVMATHGRGAIAHALLGSTTEKVVRKAPCAVLTVRTSEPSFTMP